MMRLPLVSIAIVNWNGKDYTLACLVSIAKLNYPKERLEVIVIDNASTDGSFEEISKLKSQGSNLKLIKNKTNLGFAGGMNKGLRAARGKYTLILNNDEVLHKDCVLELVKVAESDSKIALAGPKLYSMDKPNEIQGMWGVIDRNTMHLTRIGAGEIDRGQYEDIVEADFVSFSGLLRNSVLKKVGYLDESYFLSFEDTDFEIRLKNAGYKLIFVPKAKMWHKGAVAVGKDTPRMLYYIARNNFLIRKKFNGFTIHDHIATIRFLVSSLLFAFLNKDNKRLSHFAVARGIFDFYRNRFGPAPF